MPGAQDTIVRITIGSNQYAVELLNPLDGMAFGLDVAAALGPAIAGVAESIKDDGDMSKVFNAFSLALKSGNFKDIFKKSFAQCYTPENERLSDEVVFNRWFRQHPDEMFELGARATYVLVKDFFPRRLATAVTGFRDKWTPSPLEGVQ